MSEKKDQIEKGFVIPSAGTPDFEYWLELQAKKAKEEKAAKEEKKESKSKKAKAKKQK